MQPYNLNLPFEANEEFYIGKEPTGYILFLVKKKITKTAPQNISVC